MLGMGVCNCGNVKMGAVGEPLEGTHNGMKLLLSLFADAFWLASSRSKLAMRASMVVSREKYGYILRLMYCLNFEAKEVRTEGAMEQACIIGTLGKTNCLKCGLRLFVPVAWAMFETIEGANKFKQVGLAEGLLEVS
eukprot:7309613-Ditylum_brightwellii.AAC.1